MAAIPLLLYLKNLKNKLNKSDFDCVHSPVTFAHVEKGELAQLARALAWHARGRRFDSDILHFDFQIVTKNLRIKIGAGKT